MRGTEAVEISKEPALVSGFSSVSAAACGPNHSAFVSDGALYTFGSNKYHQLGRSVKHEGLPEIGADPDVVPFDGLKVVSAGLGSYHSAAITEDGALWTWGWGGSVWNGAGALGHGAQQSLEMPKRVEQFPEIDETVAQVACGHQHTVVLLSSGRLFSTGKGDYGRLGVGDTKDQYEFEEIDYFEKSNDSFLEPDTPVKIVKVGSGNNFSAVLSSSGELWIWGRNDCGQCGLGEESMGDIYSAERYPRLVQSLPTAGHRLVDFACGEHHLVVLTSTGAIFEWGNRMWLEPHPVPMPANLQDIKKVGAGEKFSFAITHSGELFTWGLKSSGCLALGDAVAKTVVEPTPVPAETFGHEKVVDVVAGKCRCLAITEANTFRT